MNRTATVRTYFKALHQHDDVPLHGHRFDIAAEFTVGSVTATAEMTTALYAIRDELYDRTVGQMLPGIDQSPVGLAAWAFERLAGQFKNLESVTVEDDDRLSGTVARSR